MQGRVMFISSRPHTPRLASIHGNGGRASCSKELGGLLMWILLFFFWFISMGYLVILMSSCTCGEDTGCGAYRFGR